MVSLRTTDKGFILNFTLLFVGVMLTIVVVTANSTQALLQSARNGTESLKAFYAADGGLECVNFFQKQNVFKPWNALQQYDCLPGMTGGEFSAGKSVPSANLWCEDITYNFTINYPNGACSKVEVDIVAVPGVDGGGAPASFCNMTVYSTGQNTCSSDPNVVERIRWKTM